MIYGRPASDLTFESGATRRRKRPMRKSIGERKVRKSGFAYQRVYGERVMGELSTGYVKVWDCRGPEAVVVDRALTIRKALNIIKRLEAKGPLFNDAKVLDH